MELPFAGVHQLCGPLLDRLDVLPRPQRAALATAFGLDDGPVPDRLMIGLAVLGLLADHTDARPLICIVDDVQWLDRASAQTLAFVARRIARESVALVFALRESDEHPVDFAGIPELAAEPLSRADSRALLGEVVHAPLDDRVRDQIIQEARGNPFALLEFARSLSPERLAGGFGLPGAATVSRPVEASLLRRLEALPAPTNKLLLVAAAEPVGDTGLLRRAMKRFNIRREAADPAARAELAEFDRTVRFSHPIVAGQSYVLAASSHDRRAARPGARRWTIHVDADRRPGPWRMQREALDDEVAAELERPAGRAQARGDLLWRPAFLEALRPADHAPDQRSDHALEAVRAMYHSARTEPSDHVLAWSATVRGTNCRATRAQMLAGEIAAAEVAHRARRGLAARSGDECCSRWTRGSPGRPICTRSRGASLCSRGGRVRVAVHQQSRRRSTSILAVPRICYSMHFASRDGRIRGSRRGDEQETRAPSSRTTSPQNLGSDGDGSLGMSGADGYGTPLCRRLRAPHRPCSGTEGPVFFPSPCRRSRKRKMRRRLRATPHSSRRGDGGDRSRDRKT